MLFIIIGFFLLTLIFNYKEGLLNLKDVQQTVTSNIPSTVTDTVTSTVPTTVPTTVPATIPSTVPTTVPATIPSTIPATIPSTLTESIPGTIFSTISSGQENKQEKEEKEEKEDITQDNTSTNSTTIEDDINYIKSLVSYGKGAIQDAIDSNKKGDAVSFNTIMGDTKLLVKDIVDVSKSINDRANASKDTSVNSIYTSVKTAYDYIDKQNVNINDLTNALNSLSAIAGVPPLINSGTPQLEETPIEFKPTSGTPKPYGDECTENKVGCLWNNNPADISNWWTEHRENDDRSINNVQWNYHSLDVGDYIKYPGVYRNPLDKTNGFVNFSKYTSDKARELKDLRAKMSSYDISFSSYESILKNDARLIDSINAEKERMKKDLTNTPRQTENQGQSQNQNNSDVEGTTCPSLKCIADFGTNIGENLCCGQTGVLQNTEYVCPSSKPTCQNFKCGSKFGQCI